ncbi:MAG: radical SAM protein, partial [Rubrobacteraceae bacterium]
MAGSYGWAEIARERKREIIRAIESGDATPGPVHAELDLTDRCNVACYFCNQQDVRTKQQVSLARAVSLIDELVEGGLRSVRLSGGGDPLAHREIGQVLDHLHARGVVVDNLTTNGALLSAGIARRLVAGRCREVIFSLNAGGAADYARMMQVKPAIFDRVLENIRGLLAARDGTPYPSVVAQFLLDRANFEALARMYDLGRSLGVDRITVGTVLNVPLERIKPEILLHPFDAERLRPYLEKVLERDKEAGLL